jgi:hypothetical protein
MLEVRLKQTTNKMYKNSGHFQKEECLNILSEAKRTLKFKKKEQKM